MTLYQRLTDGTSTGSKPLTSFIAVALALPTSSHGHSHFTERETEAESVTVCSSAA